MLRTGTTECPRLVFSLLQEVFRFKQKLITHETEQNTTAHARYSTQNRELRHALATMHSLEF